MPDSARGRSPALIGATADLRESVAGCVPMLQRLLTCSAVPVGRLRTLSPSTYVYLASSTDRRAIQFAQPASAGDPIHRRVCPGRGAAARQCPDEPALYSRRRLGLERIPDSLACLA